MAVIKPFCAIRPDRAKADKIAALPYDVYNREEAKAEVKKHPESFLKIDRAETQLADTVDTYDPQVYQKAHDTLWEMVENGSFVREEKRCYYIYTLTMNGRTQTGITACASIDDYESGVIKKHENTRAEKEQDRINHVNICNAQTGPIFLAYRSNPVINQVVEQVQNEEPLYDFTAKDQVRHTVWVISEEAQIAAVEEAFAGIGEIYIADGHHRAASAVKAGLKRRKEHPDYTGEEEFNYFLSVLFPADELKIYDYNRVVSGWNGHTREELLDAVGRHFDIQEMSGPRHPGRKGEITMYLGGAWYALAAHADLYTLDPVDDLDVSILQHVVLGPLFGIQDPRIDPRIQFVGGIRGLDELVRLTDRGAENAAFAMYPTSMEELLSVADSGRLMPPKSTWFEPKLRSGLFIHRF